MTKTEFIEKYSISDTVPVDPSKKALPAAGLSSAISEFMECKFEGITKVICGKIPSMPIIISAEYTAFFFKMLMTNLYGRAMLSFEISNDEKALNIFIKSDIALPLSDSNLRDLIRIARNAGFHITLSEKEIDLSVAFSPVAIHRVYTVSILDGKRIMLSKFVEIFSHGELMKD